MIYGDEQYCLGTYSDDIITIQWDLSSDEDFQQYNLYINNETFYDTSEHDIINNRISTTKINA